MWIIPRTSQFCHYAQDTAVSNSDWPAHWRTLCESLLWRSKPTHWRIWSLRLKRVSWLSNLCGRICEPSRQSDFEDALISSLQATRASRSVLPASGKAPTTPDTFGQLLRESSRQLSLFGASSRTCRDTLASDSPTFIAAYAIWVTKLRQDCLARQSAARPTSGNGCLSWPTTDQRMTRRGCNQRQLATEVDNWPTPNVPERGPEYSKKHRPESGGIDLQSSVQLWPTIQVADSKQPKANKRGNPHLNRVVISGRPAPDSLSTNGKSRELWATPAADYPGDNVEKLKLSPRGKATRIDNGRMVQTSLTVQLGVQRNKLNPAWVESLMGLPVGWTEMNLEI